MNFRRSLVVIPAFAVAISAQVSPAVAATTAEGPWTSQVYSCGSKYPSGQTTGHVRVRVTVAGYTNSNAFAYPGGKVSATGASHSGTVTSYADTNITSWGFSGCVAGI